MTFIRREDHPTLVNYVQGNQSAVKSWISYMESEKGATNALKGKSKSIYQRLYPSKKTTPSIPINLGGLFADARSTAIIREQGEATLVESAKAAAHRTTQELSQDDDASDGQRLGDVDADDEARVAQESDDAATAVGNEAQEAQEPTESAEIGDNLDMLSIALVLENGFDLSASFKVYQCGSRFINKTWTQGP
ncbi:hypothetical protein DFQ28_006512 [Apophysomyces sp. BC1034]|nr:hypothetical protein DFQ28_006512 [Apophysomyces sp. BC1034]